MGSIRTCVMLFVLALTLSLAATAAAQPRSGPEFIPLATPCRALDTRVSGTPISANEVATIQIGGVTTGGANCGVPTTAVGAALNFTITEAQGAGYLTAWSSGAVPLTSVVNFTPDEDVANAVDIGLGTGGTVLVQPFATTHLVVDIYGYFTDVEELPQFSTALGDRALFNNTTGSLNTATGAQALEANTTGSLNTAMGALALLNNTTGRSNTATGEQALLNNTTGSANTATGSGALLMNVTGQGNTAAGAAALRQGTSGRENTAMGNAALFSNTGNNNTAAGSNALLLSTTGNDNTAIGFAAGFNVSTGSNNIHIGNRGLPADTALIRIGIGGTQTATFIAGISGVPVTGVPVTVDGNGQLGGAASSRRVKDDIRDMEGASEGLAKLRPVTFRYKAESATGPRSIEYGLIAEEVAEIYPELVVLDKDGQPSGVRYHALPAMLLNELQRQHRVIEAQTRLLDELIARLSRLEAQGVTAGR